MIDLLKPYAKATVAFASLILTGVVLLAAGAQEAGVAMISSAPIVSGLVAATRNSRE